MAYAKVVANTRPVQKGFWLFEPDKQNGNHGPYTSESLAFNLAERVRLEHMTRGARIVVSERCHGAFAGCAVVGQGIDGNAERADVPDAPKTIKLNGAQIEVLCGLRDGVPKRLHGHRAVTAGALEKRGMVTLAADFTVVITEAGLAWLKQSEKGNNEPISP